MQRYTMILNNYKDRTNYYSSKSGVLNVWGKNQAVHIGYLEDLNGNSNPIYENFGVKTARIGIIKTKPTWFQKYDQAQGCDQLR